MTGAKCCPHAPGLHDEGGCWECECKVGSLAPDLFAPPPELRAEYHRAMARGESFVAVKRETP